MVLLVMNARDYIRLKWQSKLYEYGVTEHSDKTLYCQYLRNRNGRHFDFYMAADTCQSHADTFQAHCVVTVEVEMKNKWAS